MTSNPRLTFTALNVSDLDASITFYRLILGAALKDSNHDEEKNDPWYGGRHAACTWTDGAFMHFAVYPTKLPERPVSTAAQIGFHVETFDSTHAAIAASGALILQAPRDEPWGRTARYADPDGNVISITEST